MKRSSLVLLLLMSFTLLRSTPSFGETCPPRGVLIVGPTAYYDHISNGEPNSTACWAPVNATFVSNLPSCSIGSPTHNAFQINYASSLTQQFTVPASFTNPSFGLVFSLDFLGGHGDGFNAFQADVFDVTDGVSLGSGYHFGDMADVLCERVDIPITKNLAGHKIQVRFSGQKGYPDTYIRVYGISFFQKL